MNERRLQSEDNARFGLDQIPESTYNDSPPFYSNRNEEAPCIQNDISNNHIDTYSKQFSFPLFRCIFQRDTATTFCLLFCRICRDNLFFLKMKK